MPTYTLTLLVFVGDSTKIFVKMVHLTWNSTHPFSEVPLSDRSSVQELLRTVLDPLEPFFSPQHARVRVPGNTAVRFDQAASDLEGFARPLWGLAFLLAGKGEYRGTQWWVDGFKNGTNPDSEEYWGFPRDNDQRMVEMCPLGKLGRIIAKEKSANGHRFCTG